MSTDTWKRDKELFRIDANTLDKEAEEDKQGCS